MGLACGRRLWSSSLVVVVDSIVTNPTPIKLLQEQSKGPRSQPLASQSNFTIGFDSPTRPSRVRRVVELACPHGARRTSVVTKRKVATDLDRLWPGLTRSRIHLSRVPHHDVKRTKGNRNTHQPLGTPPTDENGNRCNSTQDEG